MGRRVPFQSHSKRERERERNKRGFSRKGRQPLFYYKSPSESIKRIIYVKGSLRLSRCQNRVSVQLYLVQTTIIDKYCRSRAVNLDYKFIGTFAERESSERVKLQERDEEKKKKRNEKGKEKKDSPPASSDTLV